MHPCGRGTEANTDIGAGGSGCQTLIGALPGPRAPRAPQKRLFEVRTKYRLASGVKS
jgi:hypothetical protein